MTAGKTFRAGGRDFAWQKRALSSSPLPTYVITPRNYAITVHDIIYFDDDEDRGSPLILPRVSAGLRCTFFDVEL